MLVNIAKAQVELGAEVWVVLVNDVYDERLAATIDKRIHFVTLGRKQHSFNPMFIVRLNAMLRRINPDAIHLHESRFFTLIFSQRLSRVAYFTLHDLPSGKVRRGGILGELFPLINFGVSGNVPCIDCLPKVFAISEAVKQELEEHYGVKSVVVCNGIPTSKFAQREPKDLTDGKLRMVQVSRLEHDKKGQDLLIEAVSRMDNNVLVDFIGDGNSREYLEQLTKQRGVESRVSFLGTKPQDYVANHLKDYALFVQPSRYEGFGLTVAEAMAANVPVLVSAGQGPAEVTCGDTYGWTFENGSIDDLVAKLNHIRTNYTEAINKVKPARQHVVGNYDVSVTAKKYLESYNKSMNELTFVKGGGKRNISLVVNINQGKEVKYETAI